MNKTLKNLTRLRIAGMLSEAARLEAEKKLMEKPKNPIISKDTTKITFG